MRKKMELALCDSCEDYIVKFASYLMDSMDVSIHIFTSQETFFADTNSFDLGILSEDFKEVADFKSEGEVKRKYFLSEDPEESSENSIYKYQSIDHILDEIEELKSQVKNLASIKKSNVKSNMIGVYSPVNHEMQLPFSMALSLGFKDLGKVLFLDLEEISVMPNLIGRTCERNLLDLLFDVNTNPGKFNINDYVGHFMGFDYINPFSNPSDICEIDSDSWKIFFDQIQRADYQNIVVLFGSAINGFLSFIERLDMLYVLGKSGNYFDKSQKLFYDYIERVDATVECQNVILPMSAANLTDGGYQIEELLQGNLGVFIKKLISTNTNRQNGY